MASAEATQRLTFESGIASSVHFASSFLLQNQRLDWHSGYTSQQRLLLANAESMRIREKQTEPSFTCPAVCHSVGNSERESVQHYIGFLLPCSGMLFSLARAAENKPRYRCLCLHSDMCQVCVSWQWVGP